MARAEALRVAFGLDQSEQLLGQFSCAHTRPKWTSQFLQGQLYVFSSCMVFRANLLAVVKTERIHFKDVSVIRKRSFMRLPNTIAVERQDDCGCCRSELFTSFLFASRKKALNLMLERWRAVNPVAAQAYLSGGRSCPTDVDDDPDCLSGFSSADELRHGNGLLRLSSNSSILSGQQPPPPHFPHWPELPGRCGDDAGDMTLVASEEVPGCPDTRAFAELLLSDTSGFLPAAYQSAGNNQLLSLSQWQALPVKGAGCSHLSRLFRYANTNSGGGWGSVTATCEQQQELRVFQDGQLRLDVTQRMPDLPMGVGNCFYIKMRWDVSPLAAAAAAAGAAGPVASDRPVSPRTPAAMLGQQQQQSGMAQAAAGSSDSLQQQEQQQDAAGPAGATSPSQLLAHSNSRSSSSSNSRHRQPQQQDGAAPEGASTSPLARRAATVGLPLSFSAGLLGSATAATPPALAAPRSFQLHHRPAAAAAACEDATDEDEPPGVRSPSGSFVGSSGGGGQLDDLVIGLLRQSFKHVSQGAKQGLRELRKSSSRVVSAALPHGSSSAVSYAKKPAGSAGKAGQRQAGSARPAAAGPGRAGAGRPGQCAADPGSSSAGGGSSAAGCAVAAQQQAERGQAAAGRGAAARSSGSNSSGGGGCNLAAGQSSMEAAADVAAGPSAAAGTAGNSPAAASAPVSPVAAGAGVTAPTAAGTRNRPVSRQFSWTSNPGHENEPGASAAAAADGALSPTAAAAADATETWPQQPRDPSSAGVALAEAAAAAAGVGTEPSGTAAAADVAAPPAHDPAGSGVSASSAAETEAAEEPAAATLPLVLTSSRTRSADDAATPASATATAGAGCSSLTQLAEADAAAAAATEAASAPAAAGGIKWEVRLAVVFERWNVAQGKVEKTTMQTTAAALQHLVGVGLRWLADPAQRQPLAAVMPQAAVARHAAARRSRRSSHLRHHAGRFSSTLRHHRTGSSGSLTAAAAAEASLAAGPGSADGREFGPVHPFLRRQAGKWLSRLGAVVDAAAELSRGGLGGLGGASGLLLLLVAGAVVGLQLLLVLRVVSLQDRVVALLEQQQQQLQLLGTQQQPQLLGCGNTAGG